MRIGNDKNYITPIKHNFKSSLIAAIPVTKQDDTVQVKTKPTVIPAYTAFVPVKTPIVDLYNNVNSFINRVNSVNKPKIVIDDTPMPNYKNNLRSMFQNNQAVIYALIPRTFNAKDTNDNGRIEGDEEPGYFTNMVERLDELKTYGINTLHVLPINPPGDLAAKGDAGSVYAPKDYLHIDPALDDPRCDKTVFEEAKYAFNECHKRGIRVMLDLPSCMSVDLYSARKDLRAEDVEGNPKTPEGWDDIRMFNPWKDEDKGILNPELMDYHKKFIDMCIDLGVDGIRADVGRAKPPQFWDELICYARSKDPEFAFLAECYTYEDASPMKNMPADRPEDVLRAGFDSYYGQYHIFDLWKAKDFHKFILDSLEITNKPNPENKSEHLYEKGKSLIGSFATHDDVSPMAHGGPDYCMMTNVVQATVPMTNPYIISGFESGDRYIYKYANTTVDTTLKELVKKPAYKQMIEAFNDNSKKYQEKYEEEGKEIYKELSQKFYNQYLRLKSFVNSEAANFKVQELIDSHKYDYEMNLFCTNEMTRDSIKYCVHNEKLDIFNKSRKPGGEHPEIGYHFGYLMNCVRPKYGELITKGAYIPLIVKNNDRDEVIAYARYKDGKALVTVVNHDVNSKQTVKVVIPGLRYDEKLTDLSPKYGTGSTWKSNRGELEINLGPAQAHIFEIENFDISRFPKEKDRPTQYL